MKYIFLLTLGFCCNLNCIGQSNFLDAYIGATVTPTVIVSSTNQVSQPQDLDFRPNSNDLWIANKGGSGGGSVVIVYNAGLSNQTSEYRKDSHTGHFMIYPSAIAFGKDGMWANTNEIKSTASATSTFMGPALWSADTAITARVFQNPWTNGLPLGSHYDMLHQSPFSMGIAHDSALAYWVNDGHNGNICLYDFVKDHGPGYDNHSAGKIWRYTDVTVTRVANVPSHMVLDKADGWLYFIDGGPKKIKRLNVNTGSITGALSVPSTANEPLAGYNKIEGATVEELDSFSTQPCGIDYYNNRLIVSDYTNGNIYIYNTQGGFSILDTITTGLAGMMGVKIGPDGRIWCVNKTNNNVYRLDAANPTLDLAITAITSPIVQNFKPHFFSTSFNVCNGTITPSVTVLNRGTTTITSATIQYNIDGGAPLNFNWTGSLASGATATVTLPSTTTLTTGNHLLNVSATIVNGVSDDVDLNNSIEGSFRTYNPTINYPLVEEFASTTFPPSEWMYIGYNPNNKMSRVTAGGFGLSTGCLKMDNFSGAEDITGQKDYFISPRVNMSNAPANAILTFSVAYAQYDANSNDELNILASTDCGATWNSIYKKSGTNLATGGIVTSAWTPSATAWRKDSVDLAAYVGQTDFQLAFNTTSNFGNNFYLDDITMTTGFPVGINDINLSNQIQVYPNPFSSLIHVELSIITKESSVIKIYTVDGRIVKSFDIKAGSKSYDLDLSNLNKGLYVLAMTINNRSVVKNIIKE